jgi:Protein of unknown function (DUF2501)
VQHGCDKGASKATGECHGLSGKIDWKILLFLKKKKQKDFCLLGTMRLHATGSQRTKVLWFFLSRKNKASWLLISRDAPVRCMTLSGGLRNEACQLPSFVFLSHPGETGGNRMRQFLAIAAVSGALGLGCAAAQAQLPGQLGNALGGLGGGGSAMGLPAVGSAGLGNTAGVLQYCMQNNYLGAGNAQSVSSGLMQKLGGPATESHDSGFAAGSSGVLQTGQGQGFSLGGSGMKQQVTQQVCNQVLQHAKSLL